MPFRYDDDEKQRRFQAVCERIAEGTNVGDACTAVGIDPATVWRWVRDTPEWQEPYALAKELLAQHKVEEAERIADGTDALTQEAEREIASLDPVKDARRIPRLRSDLVNRDKLRVGYRQWLAGRLAPAAYGDRVTHEGTIQHQHLVVELPPLLPSTVPPVATMEPRVEAPEVTTAPAPPVLPPAPVPRKRLGLGIGPDSHEVSID